MTKVFCINNNSKSCYSYKLQIKLDHNQNFCSTLLKILTSDFVLNATLYFDTIFAKFKPQSHSYTA